MELGLIAGGEMCWYVVKVQSNREKSIRDALKRRIQQEGVSEFFGDILIPVERTVDNKSGKKKVTETKLFPGYLIVQMILNDESWLVVRGTAGVGDFTGSLGKPIPMSQTEVERLLKVEAPTVTPNKPARIELASGEQVKIKDGAFEGFEGVVGKIDEQTGRVTVLIEIIGRSTPVDLESWQVEKI